MKKHILLCMTLRHLFRSKSIISLLNKLGHCESYTYSIELETALANSIVESASLLSNSDVLKKQSEGAVFHSDWDNFNQLVSDVYRAGSIHTAVGIYFQDLGHCADAEASVTSPTQNPCLDPKPNKKKRTCNRPVQELPSYYEQKRLGPAVLPSSTSDRITYIYEEQTSSQADLIWAFTRRMNSEDQIIPGLAGWVSATGHHPKCLNYWVLPNDKCPYNGPENHPRMPEVQQRRFL